MKIVSLEKDFGELFIRHGNEYKATGVSTGTRVSVEMPDGQADYLHGFDSSNSVMDEYAAGEIFTDFAITKVLPSHVPNDNNKTAAQANQTAITVENVANNVYTISGNFSDMVGYTSTDSEQAKRGNVKWVGLLVSTNESDISAVKFNNYTLTPADVSEAKSLGGKNGDFILWTYMEKGIVRFTLTKGTECAVIELRLIDSQE